MPSECMWWEGISVHLCDDIHRPFCEDIFNTQQLSDWTLPAGGGVSVGLMTEERLPLRLIFGGGWTDTPPYTAEVGWVNACM